MLNVTEINKRHTAILSTLESAPHTAKLVDELVASHLEAVAKIETVGRQLWEAEDLHY